MTLLPNKGAATMSPSGEKYTLPPCFGTSGREEMLLDPSLWGRFADLDQAGKISAE